MFFGKAEGRWLLTLRARLVASTIAAVAAALAVGFVWARRNLHDVLVEQVDETLVSKFQELAAVAAGSPTALATELQREIEVYERVEMTVRVVLDDGKVLVAPDDADGRRIAARLEALAAERTPRTITADGPPSLRAYRGSLRTSDGRTVQIGIASSLKHADDTLRLFDQRVLLGGLALLAIAAPVGLWLYRQALRPVTEAVQAARRLDPRDLSARLPQSSLGDELDQLAQVINELLAKLEVHQERIRQFTADSSHELRTPLAAIRTAIDIALQRPRGPDEHLAVLESLGEHCDRLTAIVDKLQLLARADAGRLSPRLDPVDLGALVEETVDFLRPLAEERGLFIECRIANGVIVPGDAAYLRQVVVNLIDNALKFTPRDGTIEVSASENDGRAVVAVADTGIGVRPEELANLFERFYRADAARTQKGTGLGLSICRSIVESHGGTIGAASTPGVGAVFTVTLPKWCAAGNENPAIEN